MTDDNKPKRLRVIEGGNKPKGRHFTDVKTGKPARLSAWTCKRCTEISGITEHTLVQIVCKPIECDGKLADGSIWWACGRCLKPVFHVGPIGREDPDDAQT